MSDQDEPKPVGWGDHQQTPFEDIEKAREILREKSSANLFPNNIEQAEQEAYIQQKVRAHREPGTFQKLTDELLTEFNGQGELPAEEFVLMRLGAAGNYSPELFNPHDFLVSLRSEVAKLKGQMEEIRGLARDAEAELIQFFYARLLGYESTWELNLAVKLFRVMVRNEDPELFREPRLGDDDEYAARMFPRATMLRVEPEVCSDCGGEGCACCWKASEFLGRRPRFGDWGFVPYYPGKQEE